MLPAWRGCVGYEVLWHLVASLVNLCQVVCKGLHCLRIVAGSNKRIVAGSNNNNAGRQNIIIIPAGRKKMPTGRKQNTGRQKN